MTAAARKLDVQNGNAEKVKGSASEDPTASTDWRDVTGKFKIAFERMEKDQEENAKRVRRQTETLKKHVSKAASKSEKR